jgi:hypothetical protein
MTHEEVGYCPVFIKKIKNSVFIEKNIYLPFPSRGAFLFAIRVLAEEFFSS